MPPVIIVVHGSILMTGKEHLEELLLLLMHSNIFLIKINFPNQPALHK
jgi:hypothetical protein